MVPTFPPLDESNISSDTSTHYTNSAALAVCKYKLHDNAIHTGENSKWKWPYRKRGSHLMLHSASSWKSTCHSNFDGENQPVFLM